MSLTLYLRKSAYRTTGHLYKDFMTTDITLHHNGTKSAFANLTSQNFTQKTHKVVLFHSQGTAFCILRFERYFLLTRFYPLVFCIHEFIHTQNCLL